MYIYTYTVYIFITVFHTLEHLMHYIYTEQIINSNSA